MDTELKDSRSELVYRCTRFAKGAGYRNAFSGEAEYRAAQDPGSRLRRDSSGSKTRDARGENWREISTDRRQGKQREDRKRKESRNPSSVFRGSSPSSALMKRLRGYKCERGRGGKLDCGNGRDGLGLGWVRNEWDDEANGERRNWGH